jgi:hypothetical protein
MDEIGEKIEKLTVACTVPGFIIFNNRQNQAILLGQYI